MANQLGICACTSAGRGARRRLPGPRAAGRAGCCRSVLRCHVAHLDRRRVACSRAGPRRSWSPMAGAYQVNTALVVLENTHNFGGGTVQPIEEIRAVRGGAFERGVAIHLDGARLWNAHVATGVPLAAYGREFDTVVGLPVQGAGCAGGLGARRVGGPDGARPDPAQAARRRHAPGRSSRCRRPVRPRPQPRAARRRPREGPPDGRAPPRRPHRPASTRRPCRPTSSSSTSPQPAGRRPTRRRGRWRARHPDVCREPSPRAAGLAPRRRRRRDRHRHRRREHTAARRRPALDLVMQGLGRWCVAASGHRPARRGTSRRGRAPRRASIRTVSDSPPNSTAKKAAKTGSSVMTIAARVAVRWAWAQVCAQSATGPGDDAPCRAVEAHCPPDWGSAIAAGHRTHEADRRRITPGLDRGQPDRGGGRRPAGRARRCAGRRRGGQQGQRLTDPDVEHPRAGRAGPAPPSRGPRRTRPTVRSGRGRVTAAEHRGERRRRSR